MSIERREDYDDRCGAEESIRNISLTRWILPLILAGLANEAIKYEAAKVKLECVEISARSNE